MKLRKIEIAFSNMFEITFRGDGEECFAMLEPTSKLEYIWDQLEQHIKAKLAEKLGIEEPLYKKVHPGVEYSEAINRMEWSSPDTTEDLVDISQFEDYVDRDLGLDRDNS